MSSTYLNSQLRYNFFRVGKRDVRHIGILLRVSNLIMLPLSVCYFASTCQISSVSDDLLRKYNVISIFQDGSRGRSILLPVSYLLMSVPLEGQHLSPNQISSTYIYLNSRLRYNYFRFWKKQTSAILEFYFRFRSRPLRRKCRVILHEGAEFRPNRTMRCGIMTSYRFSRWRQSDILYLLWDNSRPSTKCLSWSELGLQIVCSSD